jgi:hypothetical protein
MALEVNEVLEKLRVAEELLATVLECGTMDVDYILDMEIDHPGTADKALEYAQDLGGTVNFGCFVEGVKRMSILEIEGDLDGLLEDACSNASVVKCKVFTDEMDWLKESLDDLVIDDNYCAWGCVASYGIYGGEHEDENHDLQEAFARFVTDSSYKHTFLEAVRDFFESL